MKVLVTGGTGVVGEAVVTELVQRGHHVRLLSRNAADDINQWSDNVEAWPASIADPGKVRGSADGCDLVLHVAGIVAESPPESTFESVNVAGTLNMVREAERASCGRFIYVSSLGAGKGESEYHTSKRDAEKHVRAFSGGWMVLRPGNVYGPGDEVVSLLLKMMRILPAIPVINGGDDLFQPVWVGDLATAITAAAERPDLHGQTLNLAGSETTSTNDLVRRFSDITGRDPVHVPIPGFVASAGSALAELVGLPLPVNASQITMLREGNVIDDPADNALITVFGITPMTLGEGLKKLAHIQPEQLPEDGIGSLKRKRIWADISGSRLSPEQLFERFARDFNDATPGIVDAEIEPGTQCELHQGATLTMSLPLRGNVQVRVQEATATKATLITLSGHPLAGCVRFLSEARGDAVRFEAQVYDRPASLPSWFAMTAVGGAVQKRTWEALVERMVTESGGAAPLGVQNEEETLNEAQADLIEDWLKELVRERKRAETVAATL
ncbi:MAG: NAD-dependent epimerase/dehydratase family protein [Gemmatimonadaceae bacterium]